MSIGEALNNPIVQLVLAIIALVEFAVSVVSYFKILSVKKSQVEYRDVIELDTIINNLNNNTEVLKRIRNHSGIDMPEEIKDDIDRLVTANSVCYGAVNKANQILLNAGAEGRAQDGVVYHENGYFNKAFFDDVVLGAKHRVVLYLKRNIRPFTLDNLNSLAILADRNVKIDVFAFSPSIDPTLLEDMKKSIPSCPSTKELIVTQETNRQAFVDRKAKMKKPGNFNYFEYFDYPLSQYIIVDNKMYWGIVNFNKSDMSDPFGDRPYLEMDVSTRFAKYIIAQHDNIKKQCRANDSCF